MTKPRVGIIDSFCSKLGQSSLKGLVKIPCEHKCHTKRGSGSRSGHEMSWKVTRIKNSFSGMRHMTYSPTPRRDRERQRRVGSITGHIRSKVRIVFFLNKKICVSQPAWSQNSKKNVILFLCDVYKCSKSSQFEKWRHPRIRFLGCMFAKIDIPSWNLACQMSRHGFT